MEALVLERKDELTLRNIEIPEQLGPHDVRIAIHTVGICGSDVHYYTHGAIGPFVVREPMVLGHEASGRIVEVGSEVKNLKVGDRVCMEPGIPDPNSQATRLGMYNLDPAVRFWATPPDPRRAAPDGRASGRLHLQAARQRQLRRRRHGRAAGRRHARRHQGADQARRPGRRHRRRHHRHGHRAGRAGRRLQPGHHHRRPAAQARPRRDARPDHAGQRRQAEPRATSWTS